MLAQLSARLMATRATGVQPGNNGLGVQVQDDDGPENEVARLVLGDECMVM